MNDRSERQHWMGVLARTSSHDLDRLWRTAGIAAEYRHLRPPEVGSVMVRGRTGASGAAFNLGEMTVTRCTLRLADGTVGHGYVQGRGKAHAEQAALVDALMQGPKAALMRARIISPLAEAEAARRHARAAKAAATKVDFFTMVRGED